MPLKEPETKQLEPATVADGERSGSVASTSHPVTSGGRSSKAERFKSALAAHVESAWQNAKMHRDTVGVTERLLACDRARDGEYDADMKQILQERKGSTLFFNVTGPKIESFIAWVEDIVTPTDDRAWDMEPTPITQLEQVDMDIIAQMAQERFANQQDVSPDEVVQWSMDVYDEMLKGVTQEAKERCSRAVRKMEDQTVEGGFQNALAKFIDDLATYPTAFIKGPIVKRRKVMEIKNGKAFETVKTIPTWERVDPFNMFPGPNSTGVNDSYLCERVSYNKRDLASMRGVDGWNQEAIDQVLDSRRFAASEANMLTGETEHRARRDNTTSPGNGTTDSTVKGVEYWGSAPGWMLKEWGMKKIEDDNAYYEITAILIDGGEVIRAKLNPYPLARRPYFSTSFVVRTDSIWGRASISEHMIDCQKGANAAQRNMMNNLALAAGPQVAVDISALHKDSIDTVHEVYPLKIWPYHGAKMSGGGSGRKPIEFFQPTLGAQELLGVARYYEEKADDRTNIPKYVVGDDSARGAGKTATGLGMLMNAANRGIKRPARAIDRDVLTPAIELLYLWNLSNDVFTEEMICDVQVVGKGILAQLAKETTMARRSEYLGMTNNPTDLQIMGIRGRAMLLRLVAETLDLSDVDKVVPSDEEIMLRFMSPEEQAQGQAPGAASGAEGAEALEQQPQGQGQEV